MPMSKAAKMQDMIPMMNNHWGPPDDDNDLPDWMKASTYTNPIPKRKVKSLTEAIEDAAKQPHIKIDITKPEE